MDELAIPDDVEKMTPGRLIEDLETLIIKKCRESLTDAERTYRQAIREELNRRAASEN